MIRRCTADDLPAMFSIINEAATTYKGVIPADRWHEPYMPLEELKAEISRGVSFWGCSENRILAGVMGLQDIRDVTLVRHAYVRPGMQKRGIGTKLLNHLKKLTDQPLLVGTWKAAVWAIEFYRKNGFTPVSEKEKNELLGKYWTIPDRQIESSVVLADGAWFSRREPR